MWKGFAIKGDKVIWAIIILLSAFSIVAVYSSTGMLAFRERNGNTEYYLIKHTLILLLGLGCIYGVHQIKYYYFSRISIIAYAISIPLLILLLFIGKSVNDATRWITIPVINLSFQPSDFAKLALILLVSSLLTYKQEYIGSFQKTFLPIMLYISIICGLIFLSNFSTSAMLLIICLITMYVGRVPLKYISLVIVAGFVLILFIYLLGDTLPQVGRLKTAHGRIESFLHPSKDGDKDENFQIEQSRIAIATGGFFGKMPGNGTQKNILPYPYSDFIYAIFIEEFGLVGGVILLLLYLILLFRGVRIATKCPYTFGSLAAFGITLSIVIQALINMGVAVHLLPVTGQTLPFVSMGGTSIWFTSIAFGIILSISREMENVENNKTTEFNSEETEEDLEYAK